AALTRAQVLFAPGATVGTSTTLTTLKGNDSVIFYFVPGGTAAGVLSANPTNNPANGTVAFFSIAAANPDTKVHARSFDPELVGRAPPAANDPLRIHMMGKLNGASRDFDDVVFTFRFTA